MTPFILTYAIGTKTVSALSANGSHGSHHPITAARALVKGDITTIVRALRPPKPTGRVDISVILEQRTHGRRDPDGISGVVKPVIDGLVEGGLLKDDGHKHVRWTRNQVVPGVKDVPKDTHRLVITVEEVDA